MDYKRNVWTAAVILLAGAVLVFFHDTAVSTIVMILGGMFVLAAILNIGMQLGKAKREQEADGKGTSMAGMLTAIASGALGLWMLIDPNSLVNLLIYLFASLIIIGGIYQICTLSMGYKPLKFPFGFYVLPALMVVFGVVIVVIGPQAIANGLTLIIGISLIVYAVSTGIEILGANSMRKSMTSETIDATEADATTEPVDVKAEEVGSGWPGDQK